MLMEIPKDKKVYFASDNHLGAPNSTDSLIREKKFVKWLNEIRVDAHAIFLVGDIFDFWFEYKKVVPKGFTRTLGKLAEICDAGIPIYYFTGNHDMWVQDYFQKEIGMQIIRSPKEFTINGVKFYVGHGDGLGPGDRSYKWMKKIFTNKFFVWCFKWVHPDVGVRLGQFLSKENKIMSAEKDAVFIDEESEWLTKYCKRKLESEHYDFFIFGHRHLPLDVKLNSSSRYINLGDWITHFTFAELDGKSLSLKKYQG